MKTKKRNNKKHHRAGYKRTKYDVLEERLRRGMSGTVSPEELARLEEIAYHLDEKTRAEMQRRFLDRYRRMQERRGLE